MQICLRKPRSAIKFFFKICDSWLIRRKITCKPSLLFVNWSENLSKCMIEKFQNCRLWNWPQSNNLSKKKAKFLSKNDAHLFGCQLWWFCFVWTNFPLQFQTSWEHFNWSCCVATFNSHLSSRVDVLNTNWTSMLCLLSVTCTRRFHDLLSLHPFRKIRANDFRFVM